MLSAIFITLVLALFLASTALAAPAPPNANGSSVAAAALHSEARATTWFTAKPHQYHWNYQLTADAKNPLMVDLPGVALYILDVFDTPASGIQSLKAKGIKVVCYFR